MFKAAVATHNPPKDESDRPWDGAGARGRLRRWASSDGSGDPDTINWSRYRQGFAVVTDAGDKLGDFGFPHHDVIDGRMKTIRSGVIAAWGAARGGRTGQDNPEAQRHLQAHRKQFDLEGASAARRLASALLLELGGW